MKTLSKLMGYMKGRRALLPLALVLSALSELAGMLPFLLIWFIVRELLVSGSGAAANHATTLAWWAGGIAAFSVLLYFAALLCSHLAAFRVETNIRRTAMSRIVSMPLGFFDTTTSGKIRKIIDDNAGITHMFLAHQLPDLAGTVLVPVVAIVMIVWADWRLGLACLVPVVAAMALLAWTMNTRGRTFMKLYMNLLEQMNTQAVEYVRGIPVVKVFQQTVYSFRNLYGTIMEYSCTGGERQRISIARALLKDAPVVLLDEATASLDVENETLIQAGISALVKNKTVLIIAHRMRTIAEADKILVLENGHIAEQGTPDELTRRNGYFKRMLDMQKQ